MAKRVSILLTDEAHKIMVLHSTERTRGDWASSVFTAWANARQVEGAGINERIEARLVRIEDRLNAMAAG